MSAQEKELSREDILALIPEGAKRVKVIDEKGHERYRNIADGFDEILDGDEIQMAKGLPIVSMSQPGRRRKVKAGPVPPPVNNVAAALQAAKAKFVREDPLIQQIQKEVDSEDVLHLAMMGFAQEASSLAFERTEAERNNKETSQLSIRRIGALKALSETWIKRKEQLSGKTIDMSSPAFSKLFAFMLDTFREAMLKGGISPDQVETVFVALSERMSDETWEQEARNKMKGS
jgi:hypothetical protein